MDGVQPATTGGAGAGGPPPARVVAAANATSGDPVYRYVLLGVSVYALIALAFEMFARPSPALSSLIRYADFAVCAVFFADFLRNLRAAPDKWRYLRTWGWLDLLSSIPMADALRVGRIGYVIRIVYLLRAARATRVIALSLRADRGRDAFAITAFLCFTLVVLGSAAILVAEDGPGATILDAGQALWWAVVTLTTVGYGDVVPTTTAGRLVAVVLMIGGVGLFGALSGIVASWIVAPRRSLEAREVALLRAEIASLHERVEQVLAIVGTKEDMQRSEEVAGKSAGRGQSSGAPGGAQGDASAP